MSWVYLDDRFPDHPKVVAAGGDAAWLYICGLAYVNRNLTDGRIPKPAVARLTDRKGPAKLARRLVEVNLWEDDGEAYRIHDWTDRNGTAVARQEKARKAAKARWGKSPPDDAPSIATSNAQAMLSDESRALLDGCSSNALIPIPIPIPSKSLSLETHVGEHRSPGSGFDIRKRLVSVCTGRNRAAVEREADAVLELARPHVAEAFIDESIGVAMQVTPPPAMPRYVYAVIRQRAETAGVSMPEWPKSA